MDGLPYGNPGSWREADMNKKIIGFSDKNSVCILNKKVVGILNKKVISLSFGITLLVSAIAGCSVQEVQETAKTKSEVVIPVIFREDPQSGERSNMNLVEAFNEAYQGQYRIDVEWIVESETNYRQQIKELNALDQLPAIITDVGFDDNFYQMLVENDRLVDLEPYIEESKEWKDAIREDIYQEMKEENGYIYMSPLGNLMYSSAGIIYNRGLLKEAGYDAFPDTWEGFMQCIEALESNGITPLALHGSGTYWVPLLFASAYTSQEEEGMKFLKTRFPGTYQVDAMNRMMTFFKTLYKYTWKDALEIDYADAEERFYAGEAAIIANGPWMFMAKSEEEKEKYGFESFPGKKLVGSWQMTAWSVIKNQPQEVIEGAVEFMKFRTLKDAEDVERDIKEFQNRGDEGVMKMYLEEMLSLDNLVPNYQMNWEQEIMNEYMTAQIPDYINGLCSVEELLEGMDRKMEEIRLAR